MSINQTEPQVANSLHADANSPATSRESLQNAKNCFRKRVFGPFGTAVAYSDKASLSHQKPRQW